MIINSRYYKALRKYQQTNFPTKRLVLDAIKIFVMRHKDCFNGENGRHKNYEEIVLPKELYDAVCKIEYKLRGVHITPKAVINLACKEYAEELNRMGVDKYDEEIAERVLGMIEERFSRD
jgi:hypothetical protein